MYEEESEQAPSNIVPAVFRYKWHLAVSIPVLLVITAMAVLALPPIYRSEGRIMVETQQIPVDLVRSTVTGAASEQIDIIRQRVMTRENLLTIVNKYEHFGAQGASPIQISRILGAFISKVQIKVTSAKKGRQKVAIGFTVSFGSDRPFIAQAVTNDLVTLFLSENVKTRTQRASETTEFLRQEARKIRDELTQTEDAVAQFKRENKDALPEHLDLYVGMREDSRRQLSELDRTVTSLQEQRRILENQLALSRQQGATLDSDSATLDQLRAEYRRLLLVYQPSHPDVITVKDQIDAIQSGGANSEDEQLLNSAELSLKSQIRSLETRLESIQADKLREQEKLTDLEQRIVKIPQIERGFANISRDYETKLEQYESIVAKMQNAEMAESLEEERKAERFSILEPPILPTSPAEPDRKKLLALAFGLSFGAPVGVVFLIGFLDKSLRSSESLAKVTGEPPLVEVPIILTEQEIRSKRKTIVYGSASAFAVGLASLFLVHVMYMPLAELMSKIIVRLGL